MEGVVGEKEAAQARQVEAELVARAKAGDAEAFGEIYELNVDRIYRYVAYRVSGQAEAEDLTEQVFLKAWEAIHRYEDRGLPFGAWLFRLAHNLVVDYYRTRRQDVPLDEYQEGDAGGILAQGDPQSDFEAKVEASELRAALRQLGDDQRQVVLLRFVEGLSHAEVAAIVGKSEGATRALQHRALLTMAKLLRVLRGTDEAKVSGGARKGPGPARSRVLHRRVPEPIARATSRA